MRPAGALTCAAVAEELKGKLGIEPTARAEELLVATCAASPVRGSEGTGDAAEVGDIVFGFCRMTQCS